MSCTILRGLELVVVVVIEDNDVSLYIFFLLATFIDLSTVSLINVMRRKR